MGTQHLWRGSNRALCLLQAPSSTFIFPLHFGFVSDRSCRLHLSRLSSTFNLVDSTSDNMQMSRRMLLSIRCHLWWSIWCLPRWAPNKGAASQACKLQDSRLEDQTLLRQSLVMAQGTKKACLKDLQNKPPKPSGRPELQLSSGYWTATAHSSPPQTFPSRVQTTEWTMRWSVMHLIEIRVDVLR